MKFTKLTSLFAFLTLAVLALGFVSAQVLTFTPSSVSQTVTAGQTATIGFNLTYSSSSNVSSVNLTWSTSSSTGSITAPSLSQISNGASAQLSATFNVPSSASGTVTGSINVSSSTGGSASLPITLTVTSSSSNINIAISGAEPNGASQPYSASNNVTFTLTNTGSTSLPITMSTVSPFTGITFTPSSFTLNSGQPVDVKAILRTLAGLKFGENDVKVRATSGSQTADKSFTVKKTFCSSGQSTITNLSLDEVNWDNNGEGDENGWELLDEIEIEVTVQNDNNEDDVDAVVELGLFDSNGNNVADDLTYLSESDGDDEQIDINIDDDSDETVKWVFKVPADFDTGDYKLAVKAYNDDAGESRDCVDTASEFNDGYFESINVEQASDEGRFVIVDDIELDSQAVCGSAVSGQFTVFNVGEDDQDRVKVTARIPDMGLQFVREITSNLDQGEDETLDFSFNVPLTAKNGNHVIQFITEYDYKNGVYRQESDDSFDSSFEVIGCSSQNLGNPGSGSSLSSVRVDATLGSVAQAGKELIVIATISNTGTEDATFSLSARGYSSWAELVDVSDSTVSLNAGESKEVTFKMKVNSDATGSQTFDIQVAQDGKVQVQEVEVRLADAKASIFSSENSMIWIIGLVNLILIILIIVVAVRLARK